MTMKKKAAQVLAGCFAAVSLFTACGSATRPPASTKPTSAVSAKSASAVSAAAKQAPDFTVEDSDGKSVTLRELQKEGKPVVLNFWASWCPPCRAEMPDFQKLYDSYKDKVSFIFVNATDGDRETKAIAKGFLQKTGYTFPVYFDTKNEGAIAYSVQYLPTTLVLKPDGTIYGKVQGQATEKQMAQTLDALVK